MNIRIIKSADCGKLTTPRATPSLTTLAPLLPITYTHTQLVKNYTGR